MIPSNPPLVTLFFFADKSNGKLLIDVVTNTEKVMNPKFGPTEYLEPMHKALKVFEDPQMDLRHLVKTVSKRAEYSNDNLYQVKLFKKLEKRRGGQ